MDVSDYLPLYLAEAREHLQELSLAILHVEEAPDDRATIEEIFRTAHSLKGMSATMGFGHVAALTHEMEDVFELLRQRTEGLSRAAIDVLLECLDALSAAIESIDMTGVEGLDEAPLCRRLQALIRVRDAEAVAAAGSAAAVAEILAAAGGRRVTRVVVMLALDAALPSVRASQVIAALGDRGDVLASAPAADELEGFSAFALEVWLACDDDDEAVRRTALAVPEVIEATVVEVAPGSLVGASAPGTRPTEPAVPVAPELAEPAPTAAGQREPATPPATAGTPAPGAAGAAAGSAGRKPSASVRVDAERLDQLMQLMGELVVRRTAVESLAARVDLPELQQALQGLTRASLALQHTIMQVRMIPVEAVFLRFPRLVRDLCSKLGKQVELVLTGQDTELDRTVVDALGDPLVHLVRNSLDYGLETPAERVAAGKPPAGVLEISARQAGGDVVISVRDDGHGIDPAHVARKAVERGLIPAGAAASIDMARAIELLFASGFSTADRVTELSGRGVGMGAVRASIRALGGEATLSSETGIGTLARIRLPLTVAVVAALLVEVGGIPFAIPLDRVERTLFLADHSVGSVGGSPVLMLRDELLPLLDLAGSLGYPPSPAAAHVVVARAGEVRLALAVDSLVGERELVTRPPAAAGGDTAGVSRCAALPDGETVLIVDCDALAEAAATTRLAA